VTASLIVSCFISIPSAGEGNDAKKDFDIPAGIALETIKEFSEQSGAEVLYSTADLRGIYTKPVKGCFTPSKALDRLLEGTP
jgi:hypothetical protein